MTNILGQYLQYTSVWSVYQLTILTIVVLPKTIQASVADKAPSRHVLNGESWVTIEKFTICDVRHYGFNIVIR